MTPNIAVDSRANLIGAIWMVGAMALFAIEDAFVKAVAETLPLGQTLVLFGLGGAPIFACVAYFNNDRLFSREVASLPMRIRAVFEIFGRMFYVLALSLSPLSATTVILQATPIVVVAVASVLFQERVGWRRWLAISVGLIGVLVILKPGTDSFSVLSLLAVLGMLGFAGRDLASRAAPATLSTAVLGMYGFLSIVAAGGLYSIWHGAAYMVPNGIASLQLIGCIIAGVVAYSCLMKAMRTGEVSAVTPFRYTRLIFGVALGVFWFGEQLSLSMLMGSALIVVSGMFILWRGKQANSHI